MQLTEIFRLPHSNQALLSTEITVPGDAHGVGPRVVVVPSQRDAARGAGVAARRPAAGRPAAAEPATYLAAASATQKCQKCRS